MNNSFRARLATEMERCGYTQQVLAEKARVSQATVWRALNANNRVQPKTLADMALALGVSADWLATGEGKRTLPVAVAVGRQVPAATASDIPAEIAQALQAPAESAFTSMDEAELWEFCADTSQEGRGAPLIRRRVHASNLSDAVAELNRRFQTN